MRSRSAARKRLPIFLLLLLLLLLLPLAPVNWNGLIAYFTGGADQSEGGSTGGAQPRTDPASDDTVLRDQVRQRIAEATQRGERAADAANFSETWRALSTVVETAIADHEFGKAHRALRRAEEAWAHEDSGCAAAVRDLIAGVETAAAQWRTSELARLRTAVQAGPAEEVSRAALALLRSGDEAAYDEACAIAIAARPRDVETLDVEAAAGAQARIWRRAAAGQPEEAMLASLIELVARLPVASDGPPLVRLAHELARCAYPARRLLEGLEGSGADVAWSEDASTSALVRSRGGELQIQLPERADFEPLRVLEDRDLARVAIALFEPLGLEANDARTALAALLARSGERDAARRLLAAPPAMEEEARLRFIAALGA